MNDWLIYTFFIIFQILFCLMSGGVNIRVLYAIKISSSLIEFIKNYFWSYTLTSNQIKNREYYPEINDKIEKLLALALEDYTGCGYFRDEGTIALRIQKLRLLDDSYETIHFNYQCSCINNIYYVLTPSVFYLADKMYKKLKEEEERKKSENHRNAI